METSQGAAAPQAGTTAEGANGGDHIQNTGGDSADFETIEAAALADDEDGEAPRKREKPEVKPPEKKKFKLKIYDQEQEYEEEDVVRMAQRSAAAEKRFQEAASLEKRYQSLIENLKQDQWKIFEATGADKYAAAEKLLIEKLKLESMSPEQRRAYDLEQELKLTKEQLAERDRLAKEEQEAIAKEKFERVKSQQAESLDKSIAEALQVAGKKPTVGLVRRVAQKMLAYHHANDGKLLDPAKAVKLALDDRAPEVSEYLEGLSPEDFDKLPPTFLKMVREHFVGQVASPMAPKPRDTEDKQAVSRPRGKKQMSTDEYFKQLEKQFYR